MRIYIFIWNFNFGGVQKHTVLLANYLAQCGYGVTIIYSSKEGELFQLLSSKVEIKEYSLPNTNNPIKLFRLSVALKRIIPKNSVILCNGPNNFRQIGRINFLIRRWKLLFILQNDLEFKPVFLSSLKRLEVSLISNTSLSNIVALSTKQKYDHESRVGLKHVEVIPNFIEFDHSYISVLDRQCPKGISIGRYAYQKGYDILLEAMRQVDQNIIVDVFGYGEDERLRLTQKAKEYGLKNVNFYGAVLNVYEQLADYDFFILPSRFEPFGIVVAEALSCGLPVLTTDCDGPVDIINKKNGIIVEKDNPDSLAKGIAQISNKIIEGEYNALDIRKSAEKYAVEEVALAYLQKLKSVD